MQASNGKEGADEVGNNELQAGVKRVTQASEINKGVDGNSTQHRDALIAKRPATR